MSWQKVSVAILAMLFILGSFYQVQAQMVDIGTFKGVQIPCRLSYNDKIVEKGTYDLEFLKDRDSPTCYLRIKKGGKVLCLIDGERRVYPSGGGMFDPNIPDKPTLKMKRDDQNKLLIFDFETGKFGLFPYLLIRYKVKIID